MAPDVQPARMRHVISLVVKGLVAMHANGSDGPRAQPVDAQVVKEALVEMRLLLTVVLAHAELLERRHPNGIS